MGRPYSNDLREAGGKSGHQRPALSAASGGGPNLAVGHQYGDQLGSPLPRDGPASNRTRSAATGPKKIAGPHRDWLLQRCRKADFTLRRAGG